ncbi:tubulin monoglycylase TTLL3-like [Cyprinodon tularosa]|uniref:tubulin monoglycylase TTLL3-like n=1 Tax=Cyprinodon tularosa TaxID=77115 RepID=UPI0018E24D4F|nr:tubulin monoglycylase TTLL3-like [Cyprinodon tularosa]
MEATGSDKAIILKKKKREDAIKHCASRKFPEVRAELPELNTDRLKMARILVGKAIETKKIFSIEGPYPVIRAALRARGWIERCTDASKQQAQKRHSSGTSALKYNDTLEDAEKEPNPDQLHNLMSRLVKNDMVNFYWTTVRINPKSLQINQIINHFANAGTFTTKVGLCVNLRNLHWFDTADPATFLPRCYILTEEDERQAFIAVDVCCSFTVNLDLLEKCTTCSSVHLCNNSIQCHLRPSHQRHWKIPAHNMWLDDQLKAFLAEQGTEALWEAVAVPGMKKNIIHTLQTVQDQIGSRKNTFELYGADFMLGMMLNPWLIEINSSPTMAPSTSVTAQLCAAVQEDTLRVVLDWRVDCSANTGDFELIYRQAAVDVPPYLGANLIVEGFAV